MKRVTASEARRQWFTLLDEVAAGEVVVLERNGRRVVLRREELGPTAAVPDYTKLLRADDLDRADEWTWAWDSGGQLRLSKAGRNRRPSRKRG